MHFESTGNGVRVKRNIPFAPARNAFSSDRGNLDSGPESEKSYYNVLGWSANEYTPSEQIQIRSAAR
jgi:hypothetical protein